MGILKKSVLGKPTGAVGDILFRLKDGRTIIGTRPVSYMPGKDQKSVDRRHRFGNTAKFSKAVNAIPSLKSVWDNATPNNISPYNGIFKASYPYVTPTDISDSAKVVPLLFGFDITTTNVAINETSVTVAISAIGNNAGIDPLVETGIQLAVVIKCKDATEAELPSLMLIPLKSAVLPMSLSGTLSFSITLSDQYSELYSLFTTHKSYFALVTLKDDGKAVHYSVNLTN
ncbi:MAG: hypothetical protein NTY74_11800 [Ignavibacteriae bacterium]|nr:hypothetical protein [Ignavibacteriota bacterium]